MSEIAGDAFWGILNKIWWSTWPDKNNLASKMGLMNFYYKWPVCLAEYNITFQIM